MIKQGCVVTQIEDGKMHMTPRYCTHTHRGNQYLPYCFDREREEGRKEGGRKVEVEPEPKTKREVLWGWFMEAPMLFSSFTSNRTLKHSHRATAKVIQNPAVLGC